jgi:hypothetical protein
MDAQSGHELVHRHRGRSTNFCNTVVRPDDPTSSHRNWTTDGGSREVEASVQAEVVRVSWNKSAEFTLPGAHHIRESPTTQDPPTK